MQLAAGVGFQICSLPSNPSPRPNHAPQANFESLQALIDRIHRDAEVSKEALAHPAYQQQKENPFLFPAAGNGAAGSGAADGGAAAGTEPQK